MAAAATLLVAFWVAPLVKLSVASANDAYEHRLAFDAGVWRNANEGDDPLWPLRLRMVDSLLEERRLDGMTRAQVEQLLGPGTETDKWRDWDLVYWLGPERGVLRIDSEWLVVRFSDHGGASEIKVVRD